LALTSDLRYDFFTQNLIAIALPDDNFTVWELRSQGLQFFHTLWRPFNEPTAIKGRVTL
jgi:hypothetical protein